MSKTIIAVRNFGLGDRKSLETAVNNHFLTHIRYFYQNFTYPVVLVEVENNADVSKKFLKTT